MKTSKVDILRITTISLSLKKLLSGQLMFVERNGFNIATASFGDFSHDPHYEIKNLRRPISPYRDTLAVFEMIRLIRKLKPKIVHTHTPKAGLIGMIAAKFCGVPHRLHTVAGLPLMEKRGMLQKVLIAVERIIYGCSTMVLPNSKGLKWFIEENIYNGEKLHLVGHGTSNGVDTKVFSNQQMSFDIRYHVRKDLGVEDEDLIFFFIGRMVKDKGIVELVEAFKTVSKQVPHAKLLLVGPMEPELDPLPKETLNEIDANPAIMREGYVEDVRPYIDISHILVFPSYREGFPNVPMQAGCLEKALILSDINGCNELVQHGVNGQLVPTKRVSELVDSMLLYANDEELRKKHGKAIRETITEKYSQSYVWQELLNLYKSLT